MLGGNVAERDGASDGRSRDMTGVVAGEEVARRVAHGVQPLDHPVVGIEHAARTVDGPVVQVEHGAGAVYGEAAHRGEHAAVRGQREEARARERDGSRQVASEVLVHAGLEEPVVPRDGVGEALRVDAAGGGQLFGR